MIHPTAVVGSSVRLGAGVILHPYTVLEGELEIGDGCEIGPFVHICGQVQMGAHNRVMAGATIGTPPQDLTKGASGWVKMGSHNVIREQASIHAPIDDGETLVGSHCYVMTTAHIGHNAHVHDHVVLVNGSLLAGFVEVEERAFLSGHMAAHQHVRIGAYAMVAGGAHFGQDIPPFALVMGVPARFWRTNVVGLRRAGFASSRCQMIQQAYQMVYSGMGYKEACQQLEAQMPDNADVMRIVQFVRSSQKGIVSYRDRDR